MYTTLISPAELLKNYNKPNWVCIDCRFDMSSEEAHEKGRNDYKEAHIPGAFYAHLEEDLSSPVIPGKTGRHPLPEVSELIELFSGWGIDESVQVVVYDDSAGKFAVRLWWMLHWLGHEKTALLDGGWTHWKSKGYPVDNETPKPADRRFTARIRPELLVDVEQVQKFSSEGSALIVDSRAAERYRGEVEPLDPVAGHIPGAVNAPYAENVDEKGMFHGSEWLKSRFESVLGSSAPNEAVFYCGSGVTACHNLLALKHAGLGDGKLFAGSWSQWITNPERKVERSE